MPHYNLASNMFPWLYSDCHIEKDSLFRPKTQAARPIAKVAPAEVWDNQIIAPLQYITKKRKKS